MVISESELKRVMAEYYKRHITDRKSVAYYELLGSIEILNHARLIGDEDYDHVRNFDRLLAETEAKK